MKTYYGNYLGIVITGGEKDPEGRGRCQVFIPHIMPTLYDGWNREGQDISFDIVGNGLPESLNPDIVNTLQKILPWAECAAPIVGSSPSVKDGDEIKRNTARAMSVVGGLGPVFNFGGDIADDDIVLRTVTGRDSWEGAQCGKDAREVLSKIYGYEVEGSIDKLVPGKVPASGADGKNYAKILQNLGWTKVSDNPADVKPLTIGVWGSGPYGHVATGVKLDDGRTGWVGGSKSITTPDSAKFTRGGGSTTNAADGSFLGLWAPPPEVAEKVGGQLNASQPNVNPSGIAGGPIPVGTNMDQPPNNQPNYTSGQGVDASDGVKALVAAIGKGESNFSDEYLRKNKDRYNQINNNANVRREYNRNGRDLAAAQAAYGDYGYFQSNDATEGTAVYNYLIQQGFTNDQATYYRQAITNNRGTGNFSITDQSQALIYYLNAQYPNAVAQLNNLNANDPNFVDQVKSIAFNAKIGAPDGQSAKWFGLDEGLAAGAADPSSPQFAAVSEGKLIDVGALAQSSSIQRPTQHSASSGPNTNYQALGMFGYASEGTTVWVFFREGDPHFPVYFAASYGQREWQNMYSYSSSGIGAGAGTGALPGTEKMRLNSYGGGFESVQVSENPESGLDPQFTFQVYGKNGSNLLFTKDHTEFNSTYNHNQRVAGDLHEITEANKEERVRGDKNSYIEQDVYITVGNWTDEAIAASDEIQQYINEAMEIKSNAGKSSSSDTTTNKNEQIDIQTARDRAQQQQNEFVKQRNEIDRLQAKIDQLPANQRIVAQKNLNETIKALSNKVAAATP